MTLEQVMGELRFIRKQKKITQAEMSAALGLTRVSYSNLERSRQKMNMKQFLILCEFLETKPEEVFTGKIPTQRYSPNIIFNHGNLKFVMERDDNGEWRR